jgi:hypothetical protein
MLETDQETEIRSEELQPDISHRMEAQKATQVIVLLVGILEASLALRFLLKLIAANPHSPVAALTYAVTGIFLTPFAGLTATPSADGMVLELSTLIVVLAYGLIGWTIERLAWIIIYRPSGTKVEPTHTRRHEDRSKEHQAQGYPPGGRIYSGNS